MVNVLGRNPISMQLSGYSCHLNVALNIRSSACLDIFVCPIVSWAVYSLFVPEWAPGIARFACFKIRICCRCVSGRMGKMKDCPNNCSIRSNLGHNLVGCRATRHLHSDLHCLSCKQNIARQFPMWCMFGPDTNEHK